LKIINEEDSSRDPDILAISAQSERIRHKAERILVIVAKVFFNEWNPETEYVSRTKAKFKKEGCQR